MAENTKITFLGTGTSQGVPVIACSCAICTSSDERDKRLRSSVKIEIGGKVIVIDSGPDFRTQMLRSRTERLDALLFTHEHKDHIAGMDDIRPFNFIAGQHIQVYATERVEHALRREFYYAFGENRYPGAPELTVKRIDIEPFTAAGIPIIPIQAMHAEMPVLGFRIGDFTYLTDANYLSDSELEKILGSKVFVINALRKEKHYSHFSLTEALQIIEKVKPGKAYLTHISHKLGLHADIEKELPKGIYAAYDNLQIEI